MVRTVEGSACRLTWICPGPFSPQKPASCPGSRVAMTEPSKTIDCEIVVLLVTLNESVNCGFEQSGTLTWFGENLYPPDALFRGRIEVFLTFSPPVTRGPLAEGATTRSPGAAAACAVDPILAARPVAVIAPITRTLLKADIRDSHL